MAASAAYLLGILTAPKSGKQTRKNLGKKADVAWSKAEKQLKKLHTELVDVIDETGDQLKASKEVKEAVEQADKTKQKISEIISAIHEGDAGDVELKKAIADAGKAINALKKHLQK